MKTLVAESILTGGNHLASAMIGHGCFPAEQTDYHQVRDTFGSDCADMWVCWKAIMDCRDVLNTL